MFKVKKKIFKICICIKDYIVLRSKKCSFPKPFSQFFFSRSFFLVHIDSFDQACLLLELLLRWAVSSIEPLVMLTGVKYCSILSVVNYCLTVSLLFYWHLWNISFNIWLFRLQRASKMKSRRNLAWLSWMWESEARRLVPSSGQKMQA